MSTFDILQISIQVDHRLARVTTSNLCSFLSKLVRCITALECACTLQSLRSIATRLIVLMMVMCLRVAVVMLGMGNDLLIFCSRPQVAHGGNEVFKWFNGCSCLEIGLQSFHRCHIVWIWQSGYIILVIISSILLVN